MSSSEINMNFDLAFGQVVNVRPIPSRGVTRIEIEVPSEYHVQATNLLFNRDALIVPSWWAKGANVGPYRITKLGEFAGAGDDQGQHRTATVAQTTQTESTQTEQRATGFGSMQPQDYVKKAAILCADPDFIETLSIESGVKINSPEDAADCLRMLLNVDSRAELRTDQAARKKFDALVLQTRTRTNSHA